MPPSLKGCGLSGPRHSDVDAKETFRLLFESERGSDVILLVGAEGSQERIPAHSWVLSHHNDYFKALFNGAFRDSSLSSFIFPDDQPSSFINLIRWLYGCDCSPQSTQSALDTLQIAIKYLCPDLVHHMVDLLSRKLRPTSVLQVLAWGDHYANGYACLEPSAPPLCDILNPDFKDVTLTEKSGNSTSSDRDNKDKTSSSNGADGSSTSEVSKVGQKLYPDLSSEVSNSSSRSLRPRRKSDSRPKSHPTLRSVYSSPVLGSPSKTHPSRSCATSNGNTDPTLCCRILVSHCLSLIDSQSTEVLSSEKLESLPASVLSAVLSRDTLSISNEVLVLDALLRWSSAECRRQHKPLTLSGRRSVLGQMLLTPRLLTLSVRQISKMEDLYENYEIAFIKAKIRQDNPVPPCPPLFLGHLLQLASPRTSKSQRGLNNSAFCKRFFQRGGGNTNNKNKKEIMMNMFSLIALVID